MVERKERNKRSAPADSAPIGMTSRHCRSISMDSFMGCLSFGEELPKLPPSPGAKTCYHSRSGSMDGTSSAFSLEFGNGEFSGSEMKKIMANEKLAEIAMADPKRAKRYVKVDEVDGVELFYYFIESERNPREDPVVLWLTGGPGCSAFSGLALEIGPLKFKSERYNGSLPNLVYNPYAWTKVSNIIFLDSPVGTGFSFSQHPRGYETGDKSWSKHAEIFLRKWFVDHQQFLSNPLYIAGDSYAGKVVPLVLHHLLNDDGDEFGDRTRFNIQGYIIGNPSTGESLDYNARVSFALGMGIISDELFQSIDKNCKGEISYKNPKNAICASQIQIFEGFTSEVMTSHILEPKCGLASPHIHKFSVRAATSFLQGTGTVIPDVKCRTYAYYLMDLWSNSDAVREALHVKKGTVREWVRCSNDLIYTTDISSSIPYHLNLTTRGYTALVYSGDHDLIVPFVGTKEWIKSLQFFTVDEWRSWHVGGQVAGYTVSYSNNLTFATVKGAGHTAPEYKPRECLVMFQRWISQRSL